MSKNLGPIHYLMYEKIKNQDRITEYILNKDELENLNRVMPPISKEPLEDIIDTDNIHGFLSSKIDVVESRLSYAILKRDDYIVKMREFGAKEGVSLNDVNEVYNFLNKYLLDGMPCDFCLEIGVDEKEDLYIVQRIDSHEKYMTNPLSIDPKDSLQDTCDGGHGHDSHDAFTIKKGIEHVNSHIDDTKFYEGRLALIEGLISKSDFKVEMLRPGEYRIFKI